MAKQTVPSLPLPNNWPQKVRSADVHALARLALTTASGQAGKLANKRLLMIGTDMAIGKMTAGLEIHRWLRAQSVSATFLASGQVGMTITGRGI